MEKRDEAKNNNISSNDQTQKTLYHSISLNEFDGDQNASNKNLNALDQSSMLILNKLFGNENLLKTTAPAYAPRKISLDENRLDHHSSSLSFSGGGLNPKLEEFKRVVENSYNQHVLHKPDSSSSSSNAKSLSRQSSSNNDDQTANSAINLFKNVFNTDASLASFSHHTEQSQLMNESVITSPKAASNQVHIPYMSAYNVYNENSDARSNASLSATSHVANVAVEHSSNKINHFEKSQAKISEENNDILMKKYFDSLKKEEKASVATKKSLDFNTQKKKVSSTGSSLTSSPTSTSSLESGKKFTDDSGDVVNDYLQNAQSKTMAMTPREARPPETPKTAKSAGSTYRRSLLKLNQSKSLNQPQNTGLG